MVFLFVFFCKKKQWKAELRLLVRSDELFVFVLKKDLIKPIFAKNCLCSAKRVSYRIQPLL